MALFENFFSRLFTDKPEIPAYERLYLGEEQKKAVAANRAILPEAVALGSEINEANQSARLKSLRSVLPDLDKQIGLTSRGITDLLEGRIPKDIQDRVQNMIAGQTLGRVGTSLFDSGQGVSNLRDAYGLTSLDLFSKGLSSFNSWLTQGSQILTGPQYDITSAFINPVQQATFERQEQNALWNYNWFQNQQDAQLEPWAAALADLGDNILNLATSYYTGGASMMGGSGGSEEAGSGEGSGFYMGGGGFGVGRQPAGGPWYLGSQPGPG